MANELKEKLATCCKGATPHEIDIVSGAWISGMGLVLLLIGLSLWLRSTGDDICKHGQCHLDSETKE